MGKDKFTDSAEPIQSSIFGLIMHELYSDLKFDAPVIITPFNDQESQGKSEQISDFISENLSVATNELF